MSRNGKCSTIPTEGLFIASPRMRELRRERGISAADMAASVGYSPGHIREVERGVRTMRQGTLREVARMLECAPEELVAAPAPAREVAPALEEAMERAWAEVISLRVLNLAAITLGHMNDARFDEQEAQALIAALERGVRLARRVPVYPATAEALAAVVGE